MAAIPRKKVGVNKSEDVVTTFDELDNDINSDTNETEVNEAEVTNSENETPVVTKPAPPVKPTPPKATTSVELATVQALVTKYLFSGGKGFSLVKGETVEVPVKVIPYWRSLRLIK